MISVLNSISLPPHAAQGRLLELGEERGGGCVCVFSVGTLDSHP